MSKEKKLKAEIVFESDETRVLRNKIRHQEEQEELDEKKKLEREQERRRRRISNQKKFKKYQSMIKRIAFSNETADRLHTLKKNLKKQTQTFLTFFLTTSNKMKRKEKEKKEINKRKFIKIDEKTKFYLFPLDLINSIHNQKIRKIKEYRINHCCKIETINEEENIISIFNPSNTMNNNCVSKWT